MKHNSAIKVLMTHLGKLNEALTKANELLEGDFEMVSEYEFAMNDAANIESEIIAINASVDELRDKTPHEELRELCAFQHFLGTYYKTLPTDSGKMTKRALRFKAQKK